MAASAVMSFASFPVGTQRESTKPCWLRKENYRAETIRAFAEQVYLQELGGASGSGRCRGSEREIGSSCIAKQDRKGQFTEQRACVRTTYTHTQSGGGSGGCLHLHLEMQQTPVRSHAQACTHPRETQGCMSVGSTHSVSTE